MENTPRRSQSVDGFIPRSPQTRQIGFENRPRLNGPLQGVRVRRPGYYGPAAPTQDGLTGFTARSNTVNLPGDAPRQNLQLPQTQPPQPHHHISRVNFEPQSQAKPKGKLRDIHWKMLAKRTAMVFGVLVLLSGGWLGWKIFRDTGKVFGSSSDLLGFLSATSLKCEHTGRCNILLAGNSADDPGHDGANLTDSIMIVSLDLKNNTAFMISVPRDLYVSIPGNGAAKINEAYPDGQSQNFHQAGYAKGGMGLLEETVSQDFGIPISYYALIDYSALRDGVNAVGGVPVNIQSTDPRGLYDPSIDYKTHGPLVNLTNGWHNLNGEQALDLARARGDAYGSYGFAASDFAREQDQQKMMLALKNKIMSSSVLANPIKLGQLFDTLGNNVHTDLKTGNIRRLYDISKSTNTANIKTYALNDVTFSGQKDVNLLISYATPNGESALIPAAGIGNYSQIQLFMRQITSNNPITKEAANVVILNAGNTTGLASAEAKVLADKGIDVSATADATPQQAGNTIIDNSGGKDQATLAELKSLFGTTVNTKSTLTGTYANANFIVILGENQPKPN
jgi:LCP family protein required for cell wall assembly